MPIVAVQLASGQKVVSDFFLGAGSTIGELADAEGAQLSVASSWCVLLSPSGDCVAHSMTALATNLADGDVVTVLVGLRCSYKQRLRRHLGRCRSGRQLRRREV